MHAELNACMRNCMHVCEKLWVHVCGIWVHVCGNGWVHVYGCWVQSMRVLGAKYAETFGCMPDSR